MLRSDPSYPWGTAAIGIPDPDVLRAGASKQTLRVITRIEKEGGGDFGIEEVEGESGRGDQGGEAYNEGGDKCRGGDGGGRTGRSSPVEVFPSDAQGSPGAHQH
ncbi:hypothetical protein NDU88_010948 [Pleurodeles waltl]|uniref:Uncharacterized protein n=1 Tax=Pleurodeles waltl TaxID=8319 RepID=A0AAV7S4U9_PLEWA|nr:hypothetical protein NDU88_010948 [Pleurodeles waltl]